MAVINAAVSTITSQVYRLIWARDISHGQWIQREHYFDLRQKFEPQHEVGNDVTGERCAKLSENKVCLKLLVQRVDPPYSFHYALAINPIIGLWSGLPFGQSDQTWRLSIGVDPDSDANAGGDKGNCGNGSSKTNDLIQADISDEQDEESSTVKVEATIKIDGTVNEEKVKQSTLNPLDKFTTGYEIRCIKASLIDNTISNASSTDVSTSAARKTGQSGSTGPHNVVSSSTMVEETEWPCSSGVIRPPPNDYVVIATPYPENSVFIWLKNAVVTHDVIILTAKTTQVERKVAPGCGQAS